MSSLSAATLLAPLELKFLLLLLPYPHYRAAMTKLCPQPKLSGVQRDRLCQQLRQRHWIDYEEIVTRFGLTARGRTLLDRYLGMANYPRRKIRLAVVPIPQHHAGPNLCQSAR